MELVQQYSTTIFIMGVALIVVLIVAWNQTQRKEPLYGAGGVALLVIATLVASMLIGETPEQQAKRAIKEVILKCADAVERNQLEDTFPHIHSERNDLREKVKSNIGRYTFEEVKVKSNLTIEVDLEAHIPNAKATFNVVVRGDFTRGGYAGKSVPRFVEVFFRKEEGKWKVFRYEDHSPTEGMRKRN